MRRAAWFIVSELLLVLAIVLVFSNWQGTANFALGWPLSACTLNLTGGAQGSRIVLAFLCAILTVVTFFLGLMRLFRRDRQPTPPPPPVPQTTEPPDTPESLA